MPTDFDFGCFLGSTAAYWDTHDDENPVELTAEERIYLRSLLESYDDSPHPIAASITAKLNL